MDGRRTCVGGGQSEDRTDAGHFGVEIVCELSCGISLLVCRVASVIYDEAGWRKTFLMMTGECFSMREKRQLLYWVTRQSRASEGKVMRVRRSKSRARDSGSMHRSRRKKVDADENRGTRQDNETRIGRWSLKKPRTLVLKTKSSEDLAKTRSRIEPPS